MKDNLKEIETLLAEKKYDAVQALISSAASEKMSKNEKGAGLVSLAAVYLDISNAINTRYRDALQEAIAGMKEIDSAEGRTMENARLAAVRDKLNQ